MTKFNLQIAADNQKLDFEKHGYTPEIQIEESETFEIVTAEAVEERLVDILHRETYNQQKHLYAGRIQALNNKIPILVMDVGIHGTKDEPKSEIILKYKIQDKWKKANEIAHVDECEIKGGKLTPTKMNRLFLVDNNPEKLRFYNTHSRYRKLNCQGCCEGTLEEGNKFFVKFQ